jgi:epsilon-lactone hydrolase
MQRKITVAAVVLTTLATLSCSRLQQNSSRFDADGTAHVQRVIPVPPTVSPEAQKRLASLADRKPGPDSLAAIRTATDAGRE